MAGQPQGAESINSGMGLLAGDGALDIDQASAFLESETEKKQQQASNPSEAARIESEESDNQDESEEDETDDAEEGEEEPEAEDAEDNQEAEEAEEEDQQEELDKAPEVHTVKIDGQEVQVSLDELKSGYQRQQDYTRKTMELAENRRQLEAQIQAATEQKGQLDFALDAALERGFQDLAQFENVDWAKLKNEDMLGYLELKDKFSETQQGVYQMIEQKKALQQQAAQEQQQLFATARAEEMKRLHEKMPDFADEKKAPALANQLKQYGISQGYTPQEIGNLIDHRSIVVLDKARKYDELMKADPAKKKVKNKPKVEKPGVSRHTSASEDRIKSKHKLFMKSGDIDDAAAFFEEFS